MCPVTGRQLEGWVVVESNEALRLRIHAWALLCGLDFAQLDSASAALEQCRGSAPLYWGT